MNKIKLLYDVFKTMKEKEVFTGKAEIEAVKDQEKIFALTNEFQKNTLTGDVKAKVSSEVNTDDKKIKSENTIEFNMKDHEHCPHKGMHMHGHANSFHRGGMKAGLSRITFMLNVLNNLKVEEKDEKFLLALDLKEIHKEIKEMHLEHHKEFTQSENENLQHHKHHEFVKELFKSEFENAELNVIVNKNYEVEKVTVIAKGEVSIDALVNFSW